jgi:hypothetical protein
MQIVYIPIIGVDNLRHAANGGFVAEPTHD